MARQLVESLAGEFDPADFANEYRGELRAMLEAKLAGKEIAVPEPRRGRAGHRPHGGAQGRASLRRRRPRAVAAKKKPARKKRAASGSR